MTAAIINGRIMAVRLCEEITREVAGFKSIKGYSPALAVVLAGDNPASHIYVKNKQKACQQVGIRSEVHLLPAQVSQAEALAKIEGLNEDANVQGILIQLPLPAHLEASSVISRIDPHKDVDGMHPENLGLLLAGKPRFVPCTPLGCMDLIHSVMPNLRGKRAVVVGKSLLVGRPAGLLLGAENATVTQAHSATVDLEEVCRWADVLVSAAGCPGLITPAHVKPGAVVIDVGITRVADEEGNPLLKGDVLFEEVSQVAGYITPVPGGVGPMTVAYLLHNTLKAARGV